MEQLQFCDALVAVCGIDRIVPELAMMAGFALARGLRVIRINAPVGGLNDFQAIQQFNNRGGFSKPHSSTYVLAIVCNQLPAGRVTTKVATDAPECTASSVS